MNFLRLNKSLCLPILFLFALSFQSVDAEACKGNHKASKKGASAHKAAKSSVKSKKKVANQKKAAKSAKKIKQAKLPKKKNRSVAAIPKPEPVVLETFSQIPDNFPAPEIIQVQSHATDHADTSYDEPKEEFQDFEIK